MEFFHIILLKNCNVCLERPKINEKEAGSGPCLPKIILCLKYGIKTSHNFTAVVCYGKISFAVLAPASQRRQREGQRQRRGRRVAVALGTHHQDA